MKFFVLLTLFIFSTAFADNLKIYTNYEQALYQAKKDNKNLLMLIYIDDCQWCEKMKETTLKDQKVIEFINKDYLLVSLHKEKDNYPKSFVPRFMPTTYLIDSKTQEELYALYGYKTNSQFIYELSD